MSKMNGSVGLFLIVLCAGALGLGCDDAPVRGVRADAGSDGGTSTDALPDAAAPDGSDEGDASDAAAVCPGSSFNCYLTDYATMSICKDGEWQCPPGYGPSSSFPCGMPANPFCNCQAGVWTCNFGDAGAR